MPLEDTIELYNVTPAAIDLSGWYLTDSKNDPKKFRIPDGTVIEAFGYVVFYEYQFNPDFTGYSPYFALSGAKGDDVYLFPADAEGNLLGYRGGVSFSAAENGVSLGRYQTSVQVDFPTLSQLTFGTAVTASSHTNLISTFRTGLGAANAYPQVGPVVINEIMYHPPDIVSGTTTNDNVHDEFIELYNFTSQSVPLYDPAYPTNTWRLRDAVDFDFPANTTLDAGGNLLVVSFDPTTNATELAAFRALYSIAANVPILGPYQGKLANDTDDIELKKPDGPLPPGNADAGYVPYVFVDHVRYADTAPWPAAADGTAPAPGSSLQRRKDSDYGNDPVNWIAGTATAGRPTGSPVTSPAGILTITPSQFVNPGANVTLSVVVIGATPRFLEWRFNGAILPGATNTSLVLTNVQAANAGTYSVLAWNVAGAGSKSTRVDLALPPEIVRPPRDVVVAEGSTAVISVLAGGTPPLRYQWLKNGNLLAGATNVALSLPNAQKFNEGNYAVVITNNYGAVTSTVAILAIETAPFIVDHPVSVEAFRGANVTFNVAAGGTAPLVYQWFFNGTAIPNATSATLTLNNVQLSNVGQYTVRVLNRVGNAVSSAAALSVLSPPIVSISSPANGSSFTTNSTITITASANDLDGTVVQVEFFANESSLGTDLQAPYSASWSGMPVGQYALTARATDDRGLATISAPVTVIITLPGGTFADDFAARGTVYGYTNLVTGNNTGYTSQSGEPLHFDRNNKHSGWLTWTAPASGQCIMDTIGSGFDTIMAVYTNTSPTSPALSNLRLVAADDDSGGFPWSQVSFTAISGTAYQIAVDGYSTDDYGKITFHMSLQSSNPIITLQPVGQIVNEGADVTFSVTAIGPAPLSYRWQFNGTDLAGATSTTLALSNVQSGNEGIYQVIVSNNSGSVTSAPTSLTIRVAPSIVTPPQMQIVNAGSNVTFSVLVNGSTPLSYQWRRNGTNIVGASGSAYVLPDAQYNDGGNYSVVVANGAGIVPSQNAELIVRPAIADGELLSQGAMHLTIYGTPGSRYTVESTANLQTWAELGTVQNSAVEMHYTNSILPGTGEELYRLRLQPRMP